MRLYSTLHRDKVELPEPPGPVGIYTCGPTVYQRIHIGNGRPFVLSMWLRAWLKHQGYEVTLVENITDINDRIYDAAPGASAELAAKATQWHREDTDLLGLGRPDFEPKATETIPEIVALIEELIRDGYAYATGGDVYFRVGRYPEYGALSGQRPDQVQEQEDEANPLKEDPRDFALWKANKPDEDTWWESPWGRGRPGWHIECSAMAEKFLGDPFEIHIAGLDLVFPHNENEFAQSRAAGREFARIWMHNGMLELTGEKMSKSLGNIATLRDVVEQWGRETVLLYFMTAHWRKPMDFSDETMEQAAAQVETFRNAFRGEEHAGGDWAAFAAALDDDFDTPAALAVMHEWRRGGHLGLLAKSLAVFGLEFDRPTVTVTGEGFEVHMQGDPPDEVVQLAHKRYEARRARDFEAADSIRERIEELGWLVSDHEYGFQLVPK